MRLHFDERRLKFRANHNACVAFSVDQPNRATTQTGRLGCRHLIDRGKAAANILTRMTNRVRRQCLDKTGPGVRVQIAATLWLHGPPRSIFRP